MTDVNSDDCTFIFNEKILKAKKEILVKKSPIFKKMFVGDMSSKEIRICDINIEDFEQMIDFIYTGKLNITSINKAWELFYIADKYLLEDFKNACSNYIKKNLTMNTLVLCYEYSEMYNAKELMDFLEAEILNFVKGVFLIDYHMKSSTLCNILKHKLHGVSNFEIVLHIVQWSINQCVYKNIELDPKNVLDVLKKSNLLKFINKDWMLNLKCNNCSDVLLMCQCSGELIQQVMLLLDDSAQCNNIELERIRNSKKYWKICRFRSNYKIARKIYVQVLEEFISNICVNRRLFLFGFVLDTICTNSFEGGFYEGSISVRICKQNTNRDIIEPTVVKDIFPYSDEYYIPLSQVAVLDPSDSYDVKISYSNDSVQTGSIPIVFCYMSDTVADSSKRTVISFNEGFGTVIRGVSFYPA